MGYNKNPYITTYYTGLFILFLGLVRPNFIILGILGIYISFVYILLLRLTNFTTQLISVYLGVLTGMAVACFSLPNSYPLFYGKVILFSLIVSLIVTSTFYTMHYLAKKLDKSIWLTLTLTALLPVPIPVLATIYVGYRED